MCSKKKFLKHLHYLLQALLSVIKGIEQKTKPQIFRNTLRKPITRRNTFNSIKWRYENAIAKFMTIKTYDHIINV